MVVVAPPSKVAKPVKLETSETVNAPVRAIVPSVALVIVSPFNKVIEVVEATPPSWMTPSVALLIISPLRSVKIVVVAPPAKVANPSALIAPAAEIVTPELPKPSPTVKLVAAVCVGLNVPVTVKFPTTVDEAVERNPFENVPPVIDVVAAFKTIVPSVALVIVSPLSKVKIVVVAPPRKVAKLVTSKVEYKVAAPVAINVVDARKEPSNQDMPSNSDSPSTNKLSSAKAVMCPPDASAPTLVPEVTVKSVPNVTAPVKVLMSFTVNVPPVLMLVLIVVAAYVTAKTKTNDTNTDKAIRKKLLLFINYLN